MLGGGGKICRDQLINVERGREGHREKTNGIDYLGAIEEKEQESEAMKLRTGYLKKGMITNTSELRIFFKKKKEILRSFYFFLGNRTPMSAPVTSHTCLIGQRLARESG